MHNLLSCWHAIESSVGRGCLNNTASSGMKSLRFECQFVYHCCKLTTLKEKPTFRTKTPIELLRSEISQRLCGGLYGVEAHGTRLLHQVH